MPADDSASRARKPPAARLRPGRWLAAASALMLLAACGGSAGQHAAGRPTVTVTSTASARPQHSSGPSSPPIVAVTKGGALAVLNPATGSPRRTLVPSGVIGDEISVSAGGTVYFAIRHGCTDLIESIPARGGTPAVISTGSLPAVSPNGSQLAFASEPSLTQGCLPSNPDLTPLYKIEVRTLSSGVQATYPMVPAGQDNGLPAPISHLSWAPGGDQLAVSISSVQDNEGWNLALVNLAVAKYYMSGAGISYVAPTGQPTPRRSYLREGVYLPDGNLFVSRACCAGVPIKNTSRLLWEVNTSGALVHQVAIGYPNLEHTSLSVSASGRWLLYIAGTGLYVSHGGATPRELTTGLIAAAWE